VNITFGRRTCARYEQGVARSRTYSCVNFLALMSFLFSECTHEKDSSQALFAIAMLQGSFGVRYNLNNCFCVAVPQEKYACRAHRSNLDTGSILMDTAHLANCIKLFYSACERQRTKSRICT